MKKKVCIIYNTSKKDAIKFYEVSKEFFENCGVGVQSEIEGSAFVVVIGGDGTLLQASKNIANHNKFVIAVNMGSLGFLTDIRRIEALQVYEDVLMGNYKLEERHMLEVEVRGETHLGLNEVVMAKGGILQKLIRIRVSGEHYINTYRADGLIVATPTGSTGYSLSVGGPIIRPNLDVLLITPIAPHNLSTRPIIIDGKEEITLKLEKKEGSAYVTIDGDDLVKVTKDDLIKIKYSDKKLKLVLPKSRNYYSVLREKLKWGDKIC
ncbi:MAG: NAD(+) kinase [Fusobacteriia bacterium 4572_74]|nr:MAG: NAD(+) kinase [Fusobacteriia bacterium 4572_74]